MAVKMKKIMLNNLNVKIVKLLGKLEVQPNLQDRVKDLEEVIANFEQRLIVNNLNVKEDMIEDTVDKKDIVEYIVSTDRSLLVG